MVVNRRDVLSIPLAGAMGAGAFGADAAGSARKPLLFASVDAAAFGIIANDDSDQTARLQTAIDSLSGNGGTLVLPPGRLRISGLRLRSGVTLQGTGHTTRLEGLTAAGGAGQVALVEADAVTAVGLADLTLAGSPPEGSEPVPLLTMSDTETFCIVGVSVTGGGRGVELVRSSGVISGSVFSNIADVAIFSIDATGLEISQNTIEACGNNAIQIWRTAKGSDGTLIHGNRIRNIRADAGGSGQYGNGINVFRAGGVLATGNRIENCAYSAFRSNAGSDCQFVANSCAGLGEVAIYAEFGFEGALIANNIVDDAATGISITNFNEGGRLAVCSGNLIRNLRTRDHFDGRGTGIGAEADTLINGNVIENAPTAGISLGWGHYLRDVLACNNLVRDCRLGITVSVTKGAGPAVISGNMISGANQAAIQGMDFETASGGDLVNPSATRWPHLTLSANVKT